MEFIKTKVRKWGNSLGIVLPVEIVNKEKIKEGSEISLTIEPNDRMNVENLSLLAKKVDLRNVNIKETLKEIDKEFEA